MAGAFIKKWPPEKEPVIPWLRVDEKILRLRKITMLGRVTYAKPNPPLWEGPEDVPCTSPIRHTIVRGAPAHMKSFAIVLFRVPDLRVGECGCSNG